MNDIKRELTEVFKEQPSFNEVNEDRVLQKLQQPKKKQHSSIWLIGVSFAALVVLFIVGGFYQNKDNLHSQFMTYFEQKMAGKDYEIIFQQYDYVNKNDALVAFIEQQDNEEKIFLAYLQYEDGWQWQKTTGVKLNPLSEYDVQWSYSGNAPYLYAGVVQTSITKQILVGQKKADTIELPNDLTYWFVISDKASRVVIQNHQDTWRRLTSDENYDEITVPIVESLSPSQRNIDLKTDTMDRGNKDYYLYPIVVDSKIENIERGDVITYINDNGQQTISRILGLPDETVEIQDGTVIVNSIYSPYDYFYAKIMGETVYENYIEKMKSSNFNDQAAKDTFFYNFPETTLQANEVFVVPDNWARGKIEIISLEQLQGKVLGYEQSHFENEWSEKERNYYAQFKETNNIEVFRDVDPITYVRIQLYAQFLMDELTSYRMYTTREGHVQWSELEHLEQTWKNQNEQERLSRLRYAQLIQKGEFRSDGQDGAIVFPLENGDESMWTMTLSETGIWQSNFLPLQ